MQNIKFLVQNLHVSHEWYEVGRCDPQMVDSQ